jgi:hypothetical protein
VVSKILAYFCEIFFAMSNIFDMGGVLEKRGMICGFLNV